VGGRRVKEGESGDGIWLMDFTYLYETEPIALSEVGRA
jgi:hypothetical protein